ncbi:MAG: hypothetical protein RLZZ221_2085, partial [Verrucomicrobiota bacterium]
MGRSTRLRIASANEIAPPQGRGPNRPVRCLGIDVQQARVDRINAGVSDIGDVPSEEMAPLVKQGLLSAH